MDTDSVRNIATRGISETYSDWFCFLLSFGIV